MRWQCVSSNYFLCFHALTGITSSNQLLLSIFHINCEWCAYFFQVEITKKKARCRSVCICWCKLHVSPSSEMETPVANSKNNFLEGRKELLWFGLFPFLFTLKIFECPGQERISCYISETLKDELVQNTSLLSLLSFCHGAPVLDLGPKFRCLCTFLTQNYF